jgi:hypothetical protein
MLKFVLLRRLWFARQLPAAAIYGSVRSGKPAGEAMFMQAVIGPALLIPDGFGYRATGDIVVITGRYGFRDDGGGDEQDRGR